MMTAGLRDHKHCIGMQSKLPSRIVLLCIPNMGNADLISLSELTNWRSRTFNTTHVRLKGPKAKHSGQSTVQNNLGAT